MLIMRLQNQHSSSTLLENTSKANFFSVEVVIVTSPEYCHIHIRQTSRYSHNFVEKLVRLPPKISPIRRQTWTVREMLVMNLTM